MTITIPEWILWLLAVPVGICAIVLMGLGVMMLRVFSNFRPWG